MNTLKDIYQTFVQLAKQVRSLPKTMANAAAERRLRAVRAENEAERLDRIRNPSKYLGK